MENKSESEKDIKPGGMSYGFAELTASIAKDCESITIIDTGQSYMKLLKQLASKTNGKSNSINPFDVTPDQHRRGV